MKRLSAMFLLLCVPCFVQAQGAAQSTTSPDYAALLKRIEQLEQKSQRVDQLETQVRELQQKLDATRSPQTDAQSTPSTQTASVLPAQSDPETLPATESEQGPSLKLRGFGAVTYSGSDVPGTKPTTTIGNMELLMTSRISDRWSVLGELAFDNAPDGKFAIDIERLLLQYNLNDHLKIGAGKYFTSIGYYNTAFYNSDWAQTATTRPMMFRFPDDGGILPTQRFGLTATGRISSERLGLHYVAEVGTGDISSIDTATGAPLTLTGRTSYNGGLYIRPQAVSGLQIGGSVYHQRFEIGGGVPVVSDNTYAGYVVISRPRWEFLNEGAFQQNQVTGWPMTFNSTMMYSQFSYKLGNSMRPYFRYDYINSPVSMQAGNRVNGPTIGMRYDFSAWIGLKGEYSHLDVRGHDAANKGTTQLVFTF